MLARIVRTSAIALSFLSLASLMATLFRVECLGSANAQTGEPQAATGPDSLFPNDWYVRDGEGLEDLRSLEGKPAPEISVAEWRGEKTTLADLKGKIIVLDFWATWCGPCMAAIPKNVAFVEKVKDKGVVLIGLHDAKAGWDTVDQVIADKGINYPVALDNIKEGQGETTKAYALKFWPTYFIIDRDGIVRAAGIQPNKVEEAVLQLMQGNPIESMGISIAKNVPFPEKWFLGGEKRLQSAKEVEGKPAATLSVDGWLGPALDLDNWNQQVRVIQFVRPELATSTDQLLKLQAVAGRFASQGVLFMAVCDSRTSRDRLKAVMEEKRIELPVAMDRKPADGDAGTGVTSNAMGIKFSPATIVIDRSGKLRAAGLKLDFLDKALNQLLAESVPIPEEVVDGLQPTITASADPSTPKSSTPKSSTTEPSSPESKKPTDAKPESDR